MSSTAKPTNKGNIAMYGCGGAGINILSMFEETRGKNEVGMALIEPVYLDTARSNLKHNTPENAFFHFKNVEEDNADIDGSGGFRSTNSKIIHRQIPTVLERFRPGYANIVVSSAGGGSGSALANMLVGELISRGEQLVISIIIGDTRTNTRIRNTLNSILSFESIAKGKQTCVVSAYYENSPDKSRTDVDAEVVQLIAKLACLFSRENQELDTMDLIKFLGVHESTSYEPHLVGLECFNGNLTEETAGEGVATVVTLANDRDDDSVKMRTSHQCTGFVPNALVDSLLSQMPIQFVTRSYAFNDVVARLRSELKDISGKIDARIAKSNLIRDEKVSDLGIYE